MNVACNFSLFRDVKTVNQQHDGYRQGKGRRFYWRWFSPHCSPYLPVSSDSCSNHYCKLPCRENNLHL